VKDEMGVAYSMNGTEEKYITGFWSENMNMNTNYKRAVNPVSNPNP
jgi:hypothetical protein